MSKPNPGFLRRALVPILVVSLGACTTPAPNAPTTSPAGEADSAAQAPTVSTGPIEVRIKLTEFAIESPVTTFQTGVPYRFVLDSAGALAHDFRITPRGESQSMMGMQSDGHAHEHGNELMVVKEAELAPGTSVSKDITFLQPGEYEFACHVPGHMEAGMLLPINVTGSVVVMPTPIDPAAIHYDADAMAGMPCHAMGLTIMGDCQPEDVERLKAELLAKDAAMRARLGDGAMPGMGQAMGDGAMGMGAMMEGGMMDMDAMMQNGMMEKMMAGGMMDRMMSGGMLGRMATGRIIIDRVTRRDEPCQVVDSRIILGACTAEDIARLAAEILPGVEDEAAALDAAAGAMEDHHEGDDDHGHEVESTATPTG